MASLLLEIFSEEIPARMQADASAHLHAALEKALGAKAKMFITPRRLAAIIDDLPEKQKDISEELKGPKVGAPEAALAGFLKKTGLSKERLEERDGVYFARIEQKGRATAEVLKETIEKILTEFPWPKSMRWGAGDTPWVRPLHSILCIFSGNIVPVSFAGIHAGNTTRGHRFLAPAEITITDPAHYEALLEKAYIVTDREKRKAVIAEQLQAKCKALGVALHQDAGLLEEVTGLVEWPMVLSGKIDASYMDLPEEVLILEMKNHQKYFATREANGTLSPHFLITSNMLTADGGKAIVAGNERVLRARFADGRFFYDQDRKTTLEDWAKKLADVTYHAKLGSVADKVMRIKGLANTILEQARKGDYATPLAGHISEVAKVKAMVADTAIICKADLVTGMVGEFPELQGVMGRYYANHEKLDGAIADAIRDHYKPQGPSDSVPGQPVSICVALADKLDTLISMFAIGEKPTGSKDPFALRRAALGIIRIILENNLRLPLLPLLKSAPLREIATHAAHEKLARETEAQLEHPKKIGKYLTVNETACSDIPEGAAEKVANELLAFFHDRLKVQLKDEGIRHDVIAAVVAGGDDDLVRIVAKAKALQDFLGTDDGKNLLAGYKRAANILSIEEKKDKTSYTNLYQTHAATSQDSVSVLTVEEMDLVSAFREIAPKVSDALKGEDFIAAMDYAAKMRHPVDAFFEKVLINDNNPDVRLNRLAMLSQLRIMMYLIADFSKIEG